MIPQDKFTPHGYLDNPYHSWKLNPSGVLRSMMPLGMGWHVPNLGSYVRNQFQYTAHLTVGLKIDDLVLITPEDFQQHGCTITSSIHTKNRFEYHCYVPACDLTLRVRYFLVQAHVLGCVIAFSTRSKRALPITCYLLHNHTHNPYTSRLWEHGLYALQGRDGCSAMLGIASEGDVFLHGVRAADGGELSCGEIGYVTSLQQVAVWVQGGNVALPAVTQQQEETGWQVRTVILPCTLTVASSGEELIVNAVLARGVSQDMAYQHYDDGLEEIARIEVAHRADDEAFWSRAPQLAGDWPDEWRRGLVYDLETLRMVIRPACGVVPHPWDGMQIQAPRLVLAEAAMDCLFLSYVDPVLAKEVILGHFESAPHPQLPCMREDGSYNMVADDGQICGTAPEWGFPVWCCDLLFKRDGDTQWLRRLYPKVAAYVRWWLENRVDAEGYLVYTCSWESGQDVSSRFGPQQTGGTVIQHVRPVDLQSSMVQCAEILERWASVLVDMQNVLDAPIDFAAEQLAWRKVADSFTVKTRQMWQDGWFRDYDSATGEWSTQRDVMHLAPVFCGAAGWGHIEQLREVFTDLPGHSSGWAALCWPPVAMTAIGAASSAGMHREAVELAYRFIHASYQSTDQRTYDEQRGLPGITREYLQVVGKSKDGELTYASAGIEGYGWGALSIDLLMRYMLGLREEGPGSIRLHPLFPDALCRPGAVYSVGPIQWGKHTLQAEYTILADDHFRLKLQVSRQDEERGAVQQEQWEWEGSWGDEQLYVLP